VRRSLIVTAPGGERSVVPAGLVNAGQIEHSVAFPGVRTGAGARVRRSILLPGVTVPAGADVDSVIAFEGGRTQQPTVPHFPGGERG
jgi:glucose-1-phosphate adenylyltransferase